MSQLNERFIETCIDNANNLKSKIDQSILDIEGQSSPKVRHLLNNLCSFKNCKYLEIGSLLGSTFCSACYKNNLTRAVSIDNFSEFFLNDKATREKVLATYTQVNDCFNMLRDETIKTYKSNIEKFCIGSRTESIIDNFRNVDLRGARFNVYFYDGKHDATDQFDAIKYILPYLNIGAIIIIDDYETLEGAIIGTELAISELDLSIKREWVLKKNDGYWEGLWLGLLG